MPKKKNADFSAVIIVDIIHKGDNTYDVYMATESSSGISYDRATSEQIGACVTSMIRSLEDEYVKKSEQGDT